LLTHAAAWASAAGSSALWLTTYAHLPFNRRYYERHGYRVVPEAEWGPEIRHHLSEQRRYLPAPKERVAMRRVVRLASSDDDDSVTTIWDKVCTVSPLIPDICIFPK